ncbi:MAG: Ig-like domain-containing protein, partial [Eubacteriales bacterium]
QNGSATITLNVKDGNNANTIITFTVTVAAVNDAPVALDKTLNINEDAALQTVTKASLASDVDVATNADTITLTINTPASHGTAGIDASGNVTYVPGKDFNGTDSFVYTATDGAEATDTGTFTINIAQVNDAPETLDDTATTNEDNAVDISVLANDSDVDMQSGLNANPENESISVVITGAGLTAPSHGTIITDGTKITYTPATNYNGSDTFDYYCSDGDTQTKGTVTVTIYQVNDNPVANEDSATTDEDTLVSTDVLANDTDVDTLSNVNENALHSKDDFVIDRCYLFEGSNGTVSIDGSSILFTPNENFYGIQMVKYDLLDGHGGTATGLLTISVGAKNDAPVANPDEMSAEEDHTAYVNVLTNDTDVDAGDTKTLIGFIEPTSGFPGTFTTDANGSITFTPDENYNGNFDITYQMRDTAGLTSSAKLTVTITPVNDNPVADDGTAATNEDTSKAIDVSGLINDADIASNGDEITVSVEDDGEPTHGTISVSGNVITYTPNANYNGTDEITYTVTDSYGKTDAGLLSITVYPVNDAPIAVDDEKTMMEDTELLGSVLANDYDVDTDAALYILSVSNGTHGTATTDGESVIYTPDENYNGTDTLTYVLTDGLLTDEASITITITQQNDRIQPQDDAATTNDEDMVIIDVLANDLDVDTDTNLNKDVLHFTSDFLITSVSTPVYGTAEIVNGKIQYTPEDRLQRHRQLPTHNVSDGHGTSAKRRLPSPCSASTIRR